MNYWLMKSEPSVYAFEDLKQEPQKTAHWDGVRNYQARNFMKAMKRGDLAFFYHSSCDVPGIAGIVRIATEAYPDHTAFDKKSTYYDAKSDPSNPRWWMVDVRHKRRLKRTISLAELRQAKGLDTFRLLQRGNRLSVMPVDHEHWNRILALESSS